MFKTALQTSTRDINQTAIAKARGMYVEAVRQPGTRRCVFYFDDTPEIRDLIDRYERRECLPIPPKEVLNARTEIYHLAARVIRGEL